MLLLNRRNPAQPVHKEQHAKPAQPAQPAQSAKPIELAKTPGDRKAEKAAISN